MDNELREKLIAIAVALETGETIEGERNAIEIRRAIDELDELWDLEMAARMLSDRCR